ncbi:MAG: carboxypeptidase-like regulatory domain-containing protein, partial [Flavobacteriaceae bacterium]|nr:carboxypeptidase-like regulatory domain-containing protein [Flavobacteriaceae bacterium]
MKNLFFWISVLFAVSLSAQDKFTVNGIIKDAVNGETIFGASVYFKNTNTGVLTNEYGFYSITVTQGTYTLIVSYMGYEEIIQEIDLENDQKLDFELVV